MLINVITTLITAPDVFDYFVNPTSGNDGNSGTSQSEAFETVSAALAAVGTTGGKTIGLMDGNYGDIGTISTQFDSEVIIRSQTKNSSFTTAAQRAGGGAQISALIINGAHNLTFENIDFFVAQSDPATFVGSSSIVNMTGTWDRVKFHRCEIHSSTIEKTARGFNWRRGIGTSGTAKGKNITLTENYIHDVSRGAVLPIDDTTSDNANLVARNLVEDCYQMAIQYAGGSNILAHSNVFRNLFSVDTSFNGVITAATSNTITLSGGVAVDDIYNWTDLFFDTGDALLQSNDPFTVIDYDGATGVITIEGTFPVTPSGNEEIRLRDPSQAHQSWMPYTPTKNSNISGIVYYGNVCGPMEHRSEILSIAGLKLDDLEGTGFRYQAEIYGNLLMGTQNICVEVNNADYGTIIANNAIVYDFAFNVLSPGVTLSGDMESRAVVSRNVAPSLADDDDVNTSGTVGTAFSSFLNVWMGKTNTGAELITPGRSLSDMYDGPSFLNVPSGEMLSTFNAKAGAILTDTNTYGAEGVGPTAGFITFSPTQEILPVDVVVNGTLPAPLSP